MVSTSSVSSSINTEEKTLTVSGVGVVKTHPDQAVISLSVITESETAEKAVEANAEKMLKVVEVLKDLGVKEANIKTSWYYVSPIYNYKEKPAQIVGYRVSNTLTVTTNITLVGKIIDKTVTVGVNKINGVHFTLSKETQTQMENKALTKAIKDANTKAVTIAEALGVRLTGIKTITVGWLFKPSPYKTFETSENEAGTPVYPGEIEITARISVVYTIE